MKTATVQKEIRVVVGELLPTLNIDGDYEYDEPEPLQEMISVSRAAAVSFMKLWLQHYKQLKPEGVFEAHATEYVFDDLDGEWYAAFNVSKYAGDKSKWVWYPLAN